MKDKPTSVKAAILVEQNKPLIIDSIDLPEKLFVGQVLVQIHLSGICGSQLGEIKGVKGPDRYLPHLMGHEGYASVLDVGPGVTNVNIGDKVVLHWRKGAGIESNTPKYKWRGNNLNAGWVTTFNTHAIVSENRCTKIPQSTSPELAALYGCAITTGFGVIENNACIKMGESIVVFGAGGVGLNIIQAASLYSAWPIIAVDLFDSRLELAMKLGATHTINSNNFNPEEMINKILGTQLLDVFIDNTGLPSIIEMGYRLVKSEGKVILVGVPKKGANINIYSLPLHFGKSLIGSHGGESRPDLDIPRYNKLFIQNIASIKNLVTERVPLENINEAIKNMSEGKTIGRVLVEM